MINKKQQSKLDATVLNAMTDAITEYGEQFKNSLGSVPDFEKDAEGEFEKRKLLTKQLIHNFKSDLKSISKKYNFGIKECVKYDGNAEYCGTYIYLTIDGYIWYVQTFDEIIEETLKSSWANTNK